MSPSQLGTVAALVAVGLLAAARPARAVSVEELLKKWGAASPSPSAKATEKPSATPEASPEATRKPKPPVLPGLAPKATRGPTLQPPSKSGYYGFGGRAKGGAGGQVVTYSGGSMKSALGSGNRIVKVTGSPKVPAGVSFPSNLTVDGTGAGTGFVISGRAEIKNKHDVILKNIRFRGGFDCLRTWLGAHEIVIDHCSFNRSGDGGNDISEGCWNITTCWSLTHGINKAQLVRYGTSHISFYNTIWVNNNQRSPLFGGFTKPQSFKGKYPGYLDPTVDMRNCVVANWGGVGGTMLRGPGSGNIVNNVYSDRETPSSGIVAYAKNAKLHVAGNVSVIAPKGDKQVMTGKVIKDLNEVSNHGEFMVPAWAKIPTKDAMTAAKETIAKAGPRPLDALDQKAIQSIKLK